MQFGLFWAVVIVGGAALVRAFAGSRGGDGNSARKSNMSRGGIALQTIGFFVIGLGQIRFALPWSGPSSLVCSAFVVLFGTAAIAIFIAATKAMGKNWSVVARTRADHQLIRSGPFAVVRHPIYLALFLYMLSFAIAFGHFGQLLIGVPLYIAGAIIRIREEERLLRSQFGEEHARYVREVSAFIPFLR